MLTNSTAQNLASLTNDIRDIRPPVEIPNPWLWVFLVAGVLVLFGIVALVLILILTRKNTTSAVPPLPAHIRARQKLEEALALISQPKPFCTAVSDTLRVYLEERFEFRAPDRTTEEFLNELQRTDLLTRDQKDGLGNFLQSCDLVKFAKYEPREPELRDLHGSALLLIEETEPQPQPVPGPESEVQSSQPE